MIKMTITISKDLVDKLRIGSQGTLSGIGFEKSDNNIWLYLFLNKYSRCFADCINIRDYLDYNTDIRNVLSAIATTCIANGYSFSARLVNYEDELKKDLEF